MFSPMRWSLSLSCPSQPLYDFSLPFLPPAMLTHLGKIVRPDLVTPIGSLDLTPPTRALGLNLLLVFSLTQPGAKYVPSPRAVLVLRPRILHRHGDACRDVSEAYGRLGLVNVLPSRAPGTHDFGLYVLWVDERRIRRVGIDWHYLLLFSALFSGWGGVVGNSQQ